MVRFKFTNEISVMGVIQVVMLLVGLTAGAGSGAYCLDRFDR